MASNDQIGKKSLSRLHVTNDQESETHEMSVKDIFAIISSQGYVRDQQLLIMEQNNKGVVISKDTGQSS